GFAVYVNGSAGVVANTGTIEATGRFGDGVFMAGGAGTVTNAGMILATGHYGIGAYLHLGGTVAKNAGVIEGYSGIRIKGGAGAITNAGTIAGVGPTGGIGVALFAGGSIGNNAAGLIEVNAVGDYIAGGAGTVINFGT